ncbi:MAG TPA: 5-methyltetrahydropteroyltriglutamate--homocysteine S-methyltransferase, partial [Blastococcus sp.]|nr:5-methyltetrahydropteroyltriglutamate--homocysteine S-methyltransferase [Blastococcus sp.]
TEPPFRAEHVGSLLRPRALVQARHDFAAGRIDADGLRAAEDEAIRDVVALQEDIGLRAATDGEFRRTSWHMDFIYQLGGVTRTDKEIVVQFRNDEGTGEFIAAGLTVHKPLHLDQPIFTDDFQFLSEQVRSSVPKMTIPSPSMVLLRSGTAAVDRSVYPDLEQFWADLSAAYADEIRALAALGCGYLQLDDTSLACLNDPTQRAVLAARGEDAEDAHLQNIRTINAAIADRPAGMRIAAHVCRGNFRSSWVAEGGYDFVAEALFGGLDVDAFFCEFDDERSGGFAPLRFVPPGKQVVLGLVTTKRGRLEDPDVLKRRIDEAARYLPLDQLCLSPQCGFSSTVEGNVLNPYQEVDKLRLVVEVAQDVWGQT